MKADTLDLNSIFRKDAKYAVPMFQRPYVWNEEEHWQLLWTDLRQVVEELIAEQEAAETDQSYDQTQVEVSPHFLGTIVLDQQTTQTSKLETREIIDGQQRLITLQILFAAARAVSIEHDAGSASMLEKLMYNDEVIISDPDDRLKVWPIEANQEAFVEIMNASHPDELDSSDEEDELRDCFHYFYDEIDSWVEEGEQVPQERIEALITTLWNLVRVVVIDLESSDDAQVIFETLNARGTPLLAADLIKNFLFREAMLGEERPDELHDRYWKQFDEDKWRVEVSQGRLERPRIDVFLTHWLTMKMSQQVRAKKLFPTFRKFLKQTDADVPAVVKEIDRYASIYEEMSDSNDRSREGIFFDRLDVLDTTTPYPVLLWLYGQDDVPDTQRTKSLEAIESWLMRRMLCRLTTKNYNKIFIDLLDELKQTDPDSVGDTVVAFFRGREGSSDYWPGDEQLTEAMVDKQAWARINQRRLRMVFRAIERDLRDTGYSETLEITEKLEIEHILPQEWAHNWPLPGEKPEEVERINRDEVKNTIGNLTVLTNKLNPSVSNADWDKKRNAIQEHTVLRLNKHLVQTWPDEWNEETIAERGAWLADRANHIWHRPGSDYWDS
jgi:uncharacterized protein with ParB-like and HNH nuclease domain